MEGALNLLKRCAPTILEHKNKPMDSFAIDPIFQVIYFLRRPPSFPFGQTEGQKRHPRRGCLKHKNNAKKIEDGPQP